MITHSDRDSRYTGGETDDATFVWRPEKRILISGDFVIWAFPNAGNPRKVQRYAPDWAAALRRMKGLAPAVLIPGSSPIGAKISASSADTPAFSASAHANVV